MRTLMIGVVLVLSGLAYAEAPENETPAKNEKKSILTKAAEGTKETLAQVNQSLSRARERREHYSYSGLFNYAPLDLVIPSKTGATLSYQQDADRTYELEFLRGTFAIPFVIEDLGKITDQRLSLLKRSYFGSNSFNLIYGLTYFTFSVHIGDDILNRIVGSYPDINLIAVEALGFTVGLGNRWVIGNRFIFGVDWFSWAQPVYVTKRDAKILEYATDPDDYEAIDEVLRIASYFPRFSLFKVQAGIMF